MKITLTHDEIVKTIIEYINQQTDYAHNLKSAYIFTSEGEELAIGELEFTIDLT